MAVRLAATGGIGRLFAGAVAGGFRVRPVGPLAKFMRMARHLRYGEGRVPDSAGKTFLIAVMRHNQELSYASSYRSSRR